MRKHRIRSLLCDDQSPFIIIVIVWLQSNVRRSENNGRQTPVDYHDEPAATGTQQGNRGASTAAAFVVEEDQDLVLRGPRPGSLQQHSALVQLDRFLPDDYDA